MEEPRVGSVDQQKENIEDLSSVIITSNTSEELREIDPGPDLDLGALEALGPGPRPKVWRRSYGCASAAAAADS